MAIVVDTADGKYLISDILEQSINQSLTEPSFSTGWRRVTAATDADASDTTEDDTANGFQIATAAIDAGMMYYVGYNENFGNYKAASGLTTTPTTPRLRIGLAHSANETDGERDDVDFEAYIIRIMDGDGDEVGNDSATFASSYGTVTHTHTPTAPADSDPRTDTYENQLVVYGVDITTPLEFKAEDPNKGTVGDTGYALSNVRIVDGGDVTVAMQDTTGVFTRATGAPSPTYVSLIRVGSISGSDVDVATIAAPTAGTIYAAPPNEHRDFSMGIFDTDTSYTIQAWAVNDDDEVISPIATLEIRPVDTDRGDIASTDTPAFSDYKTTGVNIVGLVTTQFTVEK